MIAEKRSVLITGVTGFLGGVVAVRLAARGANVVGTSRHGAAGTAGADIVRLNLECENDFAALADMKAIDSVLHFAAVLPGQRKDLDVLIANQRMTYNVAQWAVARNVKRFVFASSCSVYGPVCRSYEESDAVKPQSLYAVSKLACENLLQVLLAGSCADLAILRIAAPYGPHMSAKTVITRFLERASQGLPLELLGSGSRSQDFVYEDDIAEFCLKLLERGGSGIFNVSGNRSVSTLELAHMVLELFQRPTDGNLRFAGVDPQEDYRGHFRTDRARDRLDYVPQTHLQRGLRLTAQGLRLL